MPQNVMLAYLEHGEAELVPAWNSHPHVLMSLVKEGTLQAPKNRNAAVKSCLIKRKKQTNKEQNRQVIF